MVARCLVMHLSVQLLNSFHQFFVNVRS